MTELINTVTANGLYDGTTSVSLDTSLTTQLVEIDVTKTADKTYWGPGPLTYSIEIANDEAVPYSGVTIVDTLDIAKVSLDLSTIAIDGTAVDPSDYSYDPDTGELEVTVGDIVAGASATITFQVNKV